MKVTSIRIKKNNSSDSSLLGIASVQLDNCLIIHDIKLVQLKDKRVVSFPNKKTKKYTVEDGDYQESYQYTDIVHPSNSEFRNYLEEELFRIYDLEIGGSDNE